jgi:hypothetical protein
LHLEDLFEEELSELDEIERGYLTRIVSFLPATYHALAHRFDGDPQLPRMIEKLTNRRILRSSAGTIDTYNDVFKDFLLHARLPERSHAALFKAGPVPVMKAFRLLGATNTIDVVAFGEALGKTQGATYNTLRELRIVGLVARKPEGWIVPAVVRDYEHQGRLGEYVRQTLLKNGAVSDFLAVLEKDGPADIATTIGFLKDHFSFTQAKDSVWDSYARAFISWLTDLLLVVVGPDGAVSLARPIDNLSEALGNLHLRGRGARPKRAAFLPSKELSVLERVLALVGGGSVSAARLRRGEKVALQDLMKLQAVEVQDDGRLVARIAPAQLRELAGRTIDGDAYRRFWRAAKKRIPKHEAILQCFGVSELAESTRHELGIKLLNWGRALGHVPKERIVAHTRVSRRKRRQGRRKRALA